MAYVMDIRFNNSCRLARKTYLFDYKGVRFKLVQDNPRKWADHLMAIVPSGDGPESDRAFTAGSEFVSALGWELHSSVSVWESGGRGWSGTLPLSQVKPGVFTFPRVPFRGNVIGCDLRRLPHVRTKEQRIALALFREATASNSIYLSFLFYWQILEVGGGNPIRFVNRTLRRKPAGFHIDPSVIARLPTRSRPLGDYLSDDCRHAIAHIRRTPGKRALDLDRREERFHLAISTGVTKIFAEHYIRENLNLKDSLHLVRLSPRGIPTFIDTATLHSRVWPAYAAPRLDHIFRKSGGKR